MRTAQEVMDAILGFAEENDNIRMVGMEGSRVNRNIPRDSFQDFDVTYFVTDSGQLTGDDGWLSRFGKIVMMQKPEDMELFPPEEPGYSYLMIFEYGWRRHRLPDIWNRTSCGLCCWTRPEEALRA